MAGKKLSLGNLNVTWGKEELPLLYYWDEIVKPSIQKAVDSKKIIQTRGNSDSIFILDRAEVQELEDTYYLTGRIIKSTTIEIFSQLNERGDLIKANFEENSAPYAIFFINLKNHRVGMVGSQKGAPTKSSLRYVFERILRDFVKEENNKLKKGEQDSTTNVNVSKYPFPRLSMTNLPIQDSQLATNIRNASKIKEVIIKLFPLNQDILMDDAIESVNETRKKLQSDSAQVIFKNTDNASDMADMIENMDKRGIAEITADIQDASGVKQKLSNKMRDNVSEVSTSIEVNLETVDDEKTTIMDLLDEIKKYENASEMFFRTSKTNENIYNEKFVEEHK